MEYGGKKYRRSADDKHTEEIQEDPVKVAKKAEVKKAEVKKAEVKKANGKKPEVKLSKKNIQLLRDAVIESLLSDPQRQQPQSDAQGCLGGLFRNIGGLVNSIIRDPYYSLAGIRRIPPPPYFDDENDSGLMMDDDQFFDMD
jgi:hypothetical protein